MSKMAPISQKKRKLEDGIKGKTTKPRKKIRKQKAYHSSSEDDNGADDNFAPINLNDSDDEPAQKPASKSKSKPAPKSSKKLIPSKQKPDSASSENDSDVTGAETDDSEASASDAENDDTTVTKRKVSKRNDPEAFSTSISKILSTKLSSSSRSDPLLARSRSAVETSRAAANTRLEARAKSKLRADRTEALQRGRIKDVFGLMDGRAGEVAEEEKRLRKTAQRGVVKLFNAVRAAQVRAEAAAREERRKGTVGIANREEKINEISKKGFLELISGKKAEEVEAA